jgi:hypothetical protein
MFLEEEHAPLENTIIWQEQMVGFVFFNFKFQRIPFVTRELATGRKNVATLVKKMKQLSLNLKSQQLVKISMNLIVGLKKIKIKFL